MLSTHKLLINLNEAQTAAVTTDAQNSLVLAGAQTSKVALVLLQKEISESKNVVAA